MNRATAISTAGAAMQKAIGVENDPSGDYDIAISEAAVAAVDALWPEIERLRAVERQLDRLTETFTQTTGREPDAMDLGEDDPWLRG